VAAAGVPVVAEEAVVGQAASDSDPGSWWPSACLEVLEDPSAVLRQAGRSIPDEQRGSSAVQPAPFELV